MVGLNGQAVLSKTAASLYGSYLNGRSALRCYLKSLVNNGKIDV